MNRQASGCLRTVPDAGAGDPVPLRSPLGTTPHSHDRPGGLVAVKLILATIVAATILSTCSSAVTAGGFPRVEGTYTGTMNVSVIDFGIFEKIPMRLSVEQDGQRVTASGVLDPQGVQSTFVLTWHYRQDWHLHVRQPKKTGSGLHRHGPLREDRTAQWFLGVLGAESVSRNRPKLRNLWAHLL